MKANGGGAASGVVRLHSDLAAAHAERHSPRRRLLDGGPELDRSKGCREDTAGQVAREVDPVLVAPPGVIHAVGVASDTVTRRIDDRAKSRACGPGRPRLAGGSLCSAKARPS